MSSESFADGMRKAVHESADARGFDESGWSDFEHRLHYLVGDVNDVQFYDCLGDRLDEMERAGSSPNRLFYVSTPASVAGPIIDGLAHGKLNHRGQG